LADHVPVSHIRIGSCVAAADKSLEKETERSEGALCYASECHAGASLVAPHKFTSRIT
jgi:hypothetical protein